MIPFKGIVSTVVSEIQGEVIESGFPEFGLDGDYYSHEYIGLGRPTDIVVYIDVSKEFKHLYEIGELDDWISKYSRQIPVLGIEVEYNSPHQTQAEYSERTEKSGATIPIIRLLHRDNPRDTPPKKVKDKETISVDLTEPRSIRSNVCPVISTYLMELQSTKVSDVPHISQFLESIESRVFHREEVARAYKNGQTGLLIILLSVFFESHYYNKLLSKVESFRENDLPSPIIDKDTPFERILHQCWYFGIIDDSEFRIVNSIRDSRNDYAHDIELYHQIQKTPAERDGTVDQAIKLYEDILGAKRSVIED
ncbi:hypothetical protein GJR96_14215 [Haloferax sp. MBLA0076]|uniref:DUF4145 domain-containing protein n=1 Tax=Haloferax litoreum TaxID=2666140 RepID=A0A6A8GIY4_9EURY|nr:MULTISPECIES: hypothetical protein [Haloferax]KAB1194532.1 hypothetical protein Hfx1148_14150 [Haloferax sp. CBA1148]MRX23105.1 hypothetical protein [Haloferax litoreum]